MIGKFEELALGALMKAGPDAHAAKVYDVLEETLGNVPQFAALYTALDRMARKGLVKEQSVKIDGRNRRLFTITGEGRKAYGEASEASVRIRSVAIVPGGGHC